MLSRSRAWILQVLGPLRLVNFNPSCSSPAMVLPVSHALPEPPRSYNINYKSYPESLNNQTLKAGAMTHEELSTPACFSVTEPTSQPANSAVALLERGTEVVNTGQSSDCCWPLRKRYAPCVAAVSVLCFAVVFAAAPCWGLQNQDPLSGVRSLTPYSKGQVKESPNCCQTAVSKDFSASKPISAQAPLQA